MVLFSVFFFLVSRPLVERLAVAIRYDGQLQIPKRTNGYMFILPKSGGREAFSNDLPRGLVIYIYIHECVWNSQLDRA